QAHKTPPTPPHRGDRPSSEPNPVRRGQFPPAQRVDPPRQFARGQSGLTSIGPTVTLAMVSPRRRDYGFRCGALQSSDMSARKRALRRVGTSLRVVIGVALVLLTVALVLFWSLGHF